MKNKKGFTLIELLVVISIIALLSSIVLEALGDARKKARDARRWQDIKQIQNALELYRTDKGNYPIYGWSSADSTTPTYATNWINLETSLVSNKYIPKLPIDPKTTSGIAATTPGVYAYSYYTGNWRGCTTGQWYALVFRLEKNSQAIGLTMCDGSPMIYANAQTVGVAK